MFKHTIADKKGREAFEKPQLRINIVIVKLFHTSSTIDKSNNHSIKYK